MTVAARRTERLLNLVICLLSTRRYLTKEEIRRSVEGYSEGQDAFERAFERDKEELRELGIPLEIGSNDPLFDDEAGYRIRRDAYELPPISLAPDEMAVVGLAARFWQQASLAEASSRALLKLKAQHPADAVAEDLLGIEPRLVRDEPGFEGLWQAVQDGAPWSSTTGPGTARSRAATSSRGAWSPGTAAGTSPGTTGTARTSASSASAGSPVT